MHPVELIELMIVGGILLVVLLVSFIFKGTWRKIIQGFALLFWVSFVLFYFVRPYWIDIQIEKKIGYIQMNLEEQYPGETWEYRTVPHREDGYESSNPYYIGVIFGSEPQVEYKYFARNKSDIIQSGWYTSELQRDQNDLLHLEILEE
ncbi:hypothetical protein [Psychrobacillus psychrodurans]|uniref:Uncharacterized protein n=1 Tax=Psychrobacillus psychrodurans TaxID=126157 RepID=A0A9X3L9X0_9BACI|nr:hypothetical protein [Psychrobacillus psychrodurans]MCZ8534037.1 hypothetical protein [Psychrobacillus psychrodurans]